MGRARGEWITVMVFGFQSKRAAASTTWVYSHRQIGGARFLQCQQRLHLLPRVSTGTNFNSNPDLHARILLPVPAAPQAVQREAQIPDLSMLGHLGEIGLQRKGQQRRESANGKNSVRLNRTFTSMTMTQTINHLTGTCEQAAVQTWPDTCRKRKFDHAY